jgi:hypothetical protein
MRRSAALRLLSLVTVAAVSSALTIAVMRRTAPPVPRASAALPWSMGVKSVVKGPNDSSHARGAFINLPVSCDGFSPSKAILVADEVIITRVPDTRRDVDAELRGNVHLRYTVLHD